MKERVEYTAYGAVRQLYRFEKFPRGNYQILLEGPAGTGKTRGLLEWVHYMCGKYPGIRVLFLRRTKESLAESVLDTWENHVLWPDHPCITGSAGAHNRQTYTFPNGSHIVLGGLKDRRQTEKTFSTQYDIIIFFEAREIDDMNTWQWMARANRNWKIPWQIRIADTNPGPEFHWLNLYFAKPEVGGCYHRLPRQFWERPPFTVKCDLQHVSVIPRPESIEPDDRGRLRVPCPVCKEPARGASQFRLLSKFQDNPVWWDANKGTWTLEGQEYVEGNLALLTGAPYANLYLGEWRAEEGIIYEEWDPLVHIVDSVPEQPSWYFAAFDKGLRHPGCLQVWGVVENRMYLIHEVYRTGENIDWWAAKVLELDKEYWLQAVACDPSEPEYIEKFNDMLGERRDRKGGRIARKAANAILTGIDMVRWGLSKRDGGPRMFVLRSSLESVDRSRQDAMKPTSSVQEVGSYVWTKVEPGHPMREKPDPTCSDHGMDCWRYAAMFLWGHDLSPMVKPRPYDVTSIGHILDYDAVLSEASQGWEPEV